MKRKRQYISLFGKVSPLKIAKNTSTAIEDKLYKVFLQSWIQVLIILQVQVLHPVIQTDRQIYIKTQIDGYITDRQIDRYIKTWIDGYMTDRQIDGHMTKIDK